MMMMPGRLFRHLGGGRYAVDGPVLDATPWLDAALAPGQGVYPDSPAFWVLPRSVDAAQKDVFAAGEVPLQLHGRVGPSHLAWRSLVERALASLPDAAAAAEWLEAHEVWACYRVRVQ